jgi:hypothetical protein
MTIYVLEMSNKIRLYLYHSGFQLAAHGTHVALQTIFMARKAFWVGPVRLYFCYFKNPGSEPPNLCMWPAKYLPI